MNVILTQSSVASVVFGSVEDTLDFVRYQTPDVVAKAVSLMRRFLTLKDQQGVRSLEVDLVRERLDILEHALPSQAELVLQ